MSLVAHLGDDTFFLGFAGQEARFLNGVSEGFLAIDMFAKIHGHQRRVGMGVVGELLAHLIHSNGAVSNYALNSRLVALPPDNLTQCARVIGVTAGTEKVLPIKAALNGKFLNSLIVDEETAKAVLIEMEGTQNVA